MFAVVKRRSLITFAFALLFSSVPFTLSASDAQSRDEISCDIEDTDLGLGMGANVQWARGGRLDFVEASPSGLLEMSFIGADDADLDFYIEIWAIFGSIRELVYEDIISLERRHELLLKPSTPAVTRIHALQNKYTLMLRASVSRLADGEIVQRKGLEPRFVAYDENRNIFEIVDQYTAESAFPQGVSSSAERQNIDSLPSIDFDEQGVDFYFGPGIYTAEPRDSSSTREE